MLHSVVGLAAVLTSIGSILQDVSHVSTLHLVTAYLGVVIGSCYHFSIFGAYLSSLGGITFVEPKFFNSQNSLSSLYFIRLVL